MCSHVPAGARARAELGEVSSRLDAKDPDRPEDLRK